MKFYIGYQLLLFGHCSNKGLQYQALQSSITLNASNEVMYLLGFLRNGILSFPVFELSSQQLNVFVEPVWQILEIVSLFSTILYFSLTGDDNNN